MRRSLHWLPVKQRIDYKIAVVIFKAQSTGVPAYLASLVDNYVPTRTLRSADQFLLCSRTVKLVCSRKAFVFGDRYRPAVKNVLRRIDWRIKSIFYFHNEIPKWPTKWPPPNRKLVGVSRNSRWWSSKPEVPIFQLVQELETRFQFIIPCFRRRAIQWRHTQHCHTTTEVGIRKYPRCLFQG